MLDSIYYGLRGRSLSWTCCAHGEAGMLLLQELTLPARQCMCLDPDPGIRMT